MELKLSVPWQEGCPRNQQPQDTSSEVVSALTRKEEDTGLEEKQGWRDDIRDRQRLVRGVLTTPRFLG